MSHSVDRRAGLVVRQADLMRALTAHGSLPAGFDASRIHAAALSLKKKRARAAARMWPRLARAVGERLDALFEAYAGAVPLPGEGGALADGRAFARWLHERGALPEAGRLEALAVDLRYASIQGGLVRRRWPVLKVARDREMRRLILAVRLPLIGEYWANVPAGRRGRARVKARQPGNG